MPAKIGLRKKARQNMNNINYPVTIIALNE